MKIAVYTNEFPPNIYGGAGIHVDFLTRELKKKAEIDVKCFGDQDVTDGSLTAKGVSPIMPKASSDKLQKVFSTLDNDLQMSIMTESADVVHCHTWYAHMAGIWSKIILDIPLFLTTHSLEAHRPWKEEQLGMGYHLSSWIEKTAYNEADGIIAVSKEMKKDVVDAYGVDPNKVEVIYNGIDLDYYQPDWDEATLEKFGIDPKKPMVLFVGRITRQKGISHLVDSIELINSDTQVVLCAGSPDTPEIEQEVREKIEAVQKKRDGVIWISEMVDHTDLRRFYTHADVFVCPSLYEPFGIINLEAMACKTPVVGSAVGGIPEIIVDGETGLLVPLESESKINFEPKHPRGFHNSLAFKINQLLDNPSLRESMGEAARKRVEEIFSWERIAEQTLAFYQRVIHDRNNKKQ
ncbi:MAG: glycogen synthase [Fibrobacterales bacterium]